MERTLFIGLDGATYDILDDLVRERPGRPAVMPFLGRLMDEGYRAVLESTALPLTPPAWVTILTGRNPGAHGVFDFMKFRDSGNDIFFTLNEFRDIGVETVWSMMSRQDRSVVSLNFPMMAPPPPDINGSLVPGFTSWKHLRRNMTPESLFERLKAMPDFNIRELAWDFDRENEIGLEMEDEHLARWIGYHLPREDQWCAIAGKLLAEDNPDFMAVMFDGVDKIQHQAWKYIDPELAPQYDDEMGRSLRKLCLDYYRRLDGYIEKLVTAAGNDARVFLASDHGFCATTEVVRINRYLHELGHLHWKETADTEAGRRREESPFANLDWERTTAFCPTPSSNGVVIRNVPEAEYDGFRRKLIDDLLALRHPEDGGQVITRVLPREEAFPGASMTEAPDLTLTLRDSGFVSIKNLEPAVVDRNYPMGTHHLDGVFIAWGKGIARGTAETPLQAVDMTPTFLHSAGLPVPEDLEGTVPEDCFTAEALAERPVAAGPATLPVAGDDEGKESSYSAEDEAAILDRLRMLGYME
jgi:predicted AlkP superfamily phosphohydrolase/phosphomutase